MRATAGYTNRRPLNGAGAQELLQGDITVRKRGGKQYMNLVQILHARYLAYETEWITWALRRANGDIFAYCTLTYQRFEFSHFGGRYSQNVGRGI